MYLKAYVTLNSSDKVDKWSVVFYIIAFTVSNSDLKVIYRDLEHELHSNQVRKGSVRIKTETTQLTPFIQNTWIRHKFIIMQPCVAVHHCVSFITRGQDIQFIMTYEVCERAISGQYGVIIYVLSVHASFYVAAIYPLTESFEIMKSVRKGDK